MAAWHATWQVSSLFCQRVSQDKPRKWPPAKEGSCMFGLKFNLLVLATFFDSPRRFSKVGKTRERKTFR